jgi:hypothetical protein
MITFLLIITLSIIHLTNNKKEIESWNEVIVWNGDTLWTLAAPIAKKSNLDIRIVIEDIKEYNKMSKSNIYPNQLLFLPNYK